MFLKKLRQLVIEAARGKVTLKYRCKRCDTLITVELEEKEFIDLRDGIPFKNTFSTERNESLTYFRQGLCKSCLLTPKN